MANRSGQSNSRSLLLLLLTSGFFITGLLFDYMPLIVDNQIKRTLELATNDEIRSIWSKPPVDVHSYYWLYDALNVEEYLAGEKLRVRKVGPFHFTSRIEKRIIELSQNKLRLTYNSTRHIRRNESDLESERKLDEPLRLLNPVYASLLAATRELSLKLDTDQAGKRMMVGSASRLAERFNETLFINLTAREALIGRKVVFLEKARKMLDTFGIEGEAAANLANGPKDNVFGYVAVQNNTWQGPFEIYTGYQASMPSLGELISYRGRRRLTEFRGKCNRLQTSAGELRPMPIESGQRLEIFQPSFCRILHLRPTGVRKLREGLAVSYVIAEEDFQSAQMNPENKCYCLNGTTNNYCSLNGVLELAPCSSFAPILLAMSHVEPDQMITSSLANWDSELAKPEVELQPAADNQAQMLILRRIGVPIQVDLSYVLFMRVTRDPQFRDTVSVPEISYIPALMVREIATIPPKLAQIIVNLESFLDLTQHLKVIIYLSAIVLLCWLTGNFYSGGSGSSSSQRRRAARLSGLSSPAVSVSSLAERANSADSNRSQPPSRSASRRSSPEAARTDSAEEETPDAGKLDVTADELVRVDARSQAQPARKPSSGADGSGGNLERLRRSNAFVSVDGADKLATLDELAGDSGAANPCPQSTGRSKNWFMQVCSSFVRILSGIRSSQTANGSGAGGSGEQTENELQRDKQLEILAAKIDNWYGGANEQPPAPTSQVQMTTAEQAVNSELGAAEIASIKPADQAASADSKAETLNEDKVLGTGTGGTDIDDAAERGRIESQLAAKRIRQPSMELERPIDPANGNESGQKAPDKSPDSSNDDEGDEDDNQSQKPKSSVGSREPASADSTNSMASKERLADKTNALERMEAALVA